MSASPYTISVGRRRKAKAQRSCIATRPAKPADSTATVRYVAHRAQSGKALAGFCAHRVADPYRIIALVGFAPLVCVQNVKRLLTRRPRHSRRILARVDTVP